MAIQKSLDLLKARTKQKMVLFMEECKSKWYNIQPFETLRTRSRQAYMVKIWKSWTMNSKHLVGEAVDFVFVQHNWQVTRAGRRRDLIPIGKKYWLKNLAPKEYCHFEDNGQPLDLVKVIMSKYKELFEKEVKDPIFSAHEWSSPISEEDTKYLLEIAVSRFEQKFMAKVVELLSVKK